MSVSVDASEICCRTALFSISNSCFWVKGVKLFKACIWLVLTLAARLRRTDFAFLGSLSDALDIRGSTCMYCLANQVLG